MIARDAKSLLNRYQAVRRTTEGLARSLTPEDCQIQSMPDASPVKWHLAHTSWFFETFLLLPHLQGYSVFDPAFGFLFNSYYNAIGDRVPRARRGLMSRPTLDEVFAYRGAIDVTMSRLLESIDDALVPLIDLGLNHEQQHQELILTDIKHAFSQNPLRPAFLDRVDEPPSGLVPPIEWMEFSGGVHSIGHDGQGFAFDNESPRHRVLLEDYQLASRPITCGEYLGFIDDGGYTRPEFWLSDGWAVVTSQRWLAPSYWESTDVDWSIMTLHGRRRLDPAEPVCHVSFYEADAFARWAGARLPTEAEWEVAVSDQSPTGHFLEFDSLHPRPAPGAGIAQFFGDVWEWTRSPYTPYPGSRPAEGALGEYNAKFMCNQLVLRGGSCATPASHIRATYRNFFPPEARWQFTGIRLAKDS
jgi:ergothioneine biosynthesis protein EgtB